MYEIVNFAGVVVDKTPSLRSAQLALDFYLHKTLRPHHLRRAVEAARITPKEA